MHSLVQEMNPRVKVEIDQRPLQQVDGELIAKFDVVCVGRFSSFSLLVLLFSSIIVFTFVKEQVNNSCRESGALFYTVCGYGMHGWAFNDLGEYFEYVTFVFNI